MPLWCAFLFAEAPALVLAAAQSMSPMAVGVPLGVLLFAFGLLWVFQSAALMWALKFTWSWTDSDPGLPWFGAFVLVLRASPVITLVALLAESAAAGLGGLFLSGPADGTSLALFRDLVGFGARLLLYNKVMELEWRAVFTLAAVQSVATVVGLVALIALASGVAGG
jgi:hypothetical protein